MALDKSAIRLIDASLKAVYFPPSPRCCQYLFFIFSVSMSLCHLRMDLCSSSFILHGLLESEKLHFYLFRKILRYRLFIYFLCSILCFHYVTWNRYPLDFPFLSSMSLIHSLVFSITSLIFVVHSE